MVTSCINKFYPTALSTFSTGLEKCYYKEEFIYSWLPYIFPLPDYLSFSQKTLAMMLQKIFAIVGDKLSPISSHQMRTAPTLAPPFGTDLVSQGLWECLDRFVNIYGRQSILPFTFNLRKRELTLVKLTKFRNSGLKMCHSSMPIATMAALLMLYYKLSYPPSCPDVWEAAKLFILFCVVALIPCFTPTSFLITFKAMELCAIINPVKHLGDRFRGKIRLGFLQRL